MAGTATLPVFRVSATDRILTSLVVALPPGPSDGPADLSATFADQVFLVREPPLRHLQLAKAHSRPSILVLDYFRVGRLGNRWPLSGLYSFEPPLICPVPGYPLGRGYE